MRFQMGFVAGSPIAAGTGFQFKDAVAQSGSRGINVISAGGAAGNVAVIMAAARVVSQTTLIDTLPSGWTLVSAAARKVTDGGTDEMAIVAACKKLNGAETTANFFTSAGAQFIYHLYLFENSVRSVTKGGVVVTDAIVGSGATVLWARNPEAETLSLAAAVAPVVACALFARVNGITDPTFASPDEQLDTTSGVLRLSSRVKVSLASPANVSLDMGDGGSASVTGGLVGFWVQG